MVVAQLINLRKRYKNGRGIADISLQIEEGSVFGLLGPNGSGKTTMMKCMAGLMRPSSGQVHLWGQDPTEDIEKALKNVGCLIEAPSFYPYMTAEQNLAIVRRMHPGCPAQNIDEVLLQTGLQAYRKEKVAKFSLGMKQRLGLAMALLHEPGLLILDEPSNGLDIEGMAQVRDILKRLAGQGRTILVSSHLAAEIEQMCTHIAIIREGRLLAVSPVDQILGSYKNIEDYYLAQIADREEMAAS